MRDDTNDTPPEGQDSEDAERDYEVGYKKPPKQSRWKKGQSGNPKGRAKGSKDFKTDVREVLKTPVRVHQDGTSRTMSSQRAGLEKLRQNALAGKNEKALAQFLALGAQYNNEEFGDQMGSRSAADEAIVENLKARLRHQIEREDTDDDDS